MAASSNNFQLLQVETSLYLWLWFPKKVEWEKVAQLMKIDPKRPRHLYKISHWRELRLLILERWSFRVNEFTSKKFKSRLFYWGIELVRWQKVLQLHSTPSSQPRRLGTGSGVLRNHCLSALQEIGREERTPKVFVVLSSTSSMLFYFTVLVYLLYEC